MTWTSLNAQLDVCSYMIASTHSSLYWNEVFRRLVVSVVADRILVLKEVASSLMNGVWMWSLNRCATCTGPLVNPRTNMTLCQRRGSQCGRQQQLRSFPCSLSLYKPRTTLEELRGIRLLFIVHQPRKKTCQPVFSARSSRVFYHMILREDARANYL